MTEAVADTSSEPQPQPTPAEDAEHGPFDLLDPQSYTAQRLKHATPEHLYLTTRRCFIGPIPEGWLKDHRRDWYKHHLHIHYSSRSATFSASANTGSQRSVTALDAPGGRNAAYQASFPQPHALADAHFLSEQEEEARPDGNVVVLEPPAIDIPRASESDIEHHTEQHAKDQGTDIADTSNTINDSKPPTQPSFADPADDAPHTPSNQDPIRIKPSRQKSGASFVTAREIPDSPSIHPATPDHNEDTSRNLDGRPKLSSENFDSVHATSSPAASSTTPLVKANRDGNDEREQPSPEQRKGILDKMRPRTSYQKKASQADNSEDQGNARPTTGLVRFNLPTTTVKEDGEVEEQRLLKSRLARFPRRETLKRLRKGKVKDGEILKWEKMLVRVEFTTHELQDEFDENDSQKIESQTLSKWREYIVVCRQSADADDEFILQMYKTRVIQAVEKDSTKRKAAHHITLNSKTKINIFSSLDKTIVLWEKYKIGRRIFIMRPHSGANSMEWFTYLRSLLGWQRSSFLHVDVPDLDVSLKVEQPFSNLETSDNLIKAAQGDEEALARAVEEEEAVAAKIVLRCMKMLENSPEWGSIVDAWATTSLKDTNILAHTVTAHGYGKQGIVHGYAGHVPVGLAWKRYDRLEWVHGANERSMYGTIGMEKSHELELRPKQHYSTSLVNQNGNTIVEPAPVEGFLIRLTSQKGLVKRFGKVFFKRLYFSTHSQYLVFNRPAQADPPPPPSLPMRSDSKVPRSSTIAAKIPLIYAINPYPIEDGQVQWLSSKYPASRQDVANRDQDAYDENERRTNVLLQCDGVINLCNVVRIRKMRHGATPADHNVEDGPDIDFHDDVDETLGEDGSTNELDEDRTFEMVLRNGLVVRLQAFDGTTKQEWMRRLRRLVSYWTQRTAHDINIYKSVRRQNLERLKIDEDMEAVVGQFAHKWEVKQSFASPELYHMCGISCCRTVQISGILYRKPRLHSSFQRCRVILTHGHLLLFQDIMRDRGERVVSSIQNPRVTSLDLNDCYVYSGLITTNDLNARATGSVFDRAHPGSHNGLPRMYTEDGWSSTDEDSMTCFVIWHGKRRSWFRSERAQGQGGGATPKVKLVGQLGKEGRAVVFKTRSRAERDHWVMNVAMEIERLSGREDVRIVE